MFRWLEERQVKMIAGESVSLSFDELSRLGNRYQYTLTKFKWIENIIITSVFSYILLLILYIFSSIVIKVWVILCFCPFHDYLLFLYPWDTILVFY